MTKHVEPTKPIEAVPAVERVIEKPVFTVEQLQHLTNASVLRQTAAVLRISGWCTGSMKNMLGAHCVLGAFGAAVGLDGGEGEEGYVYAHVPAAQVLGNHLANSQFSSANVVVRWNDRQTNPSPILRTLNLLADREEALAR